MKVYFENLGKNKEKPNEKFSHSAFLCFRSKDLVMI